MHGFRVFRLPTGIHDAPSFFAAVRSTCRLCPPIDEDDWDDLADSLREGLSDLADDRIAIVWPDASLMKSFSRGPFDTAQWVLEDLVETLADERLTDRPTKHLLILVG